MSVVIRRAAILFKCCQIFALPALNLVRTVNSSYSFLTWLLSGHNLQNVSTKKDSTHKSKVLISRKLIILWRYSSVSIARTMWCQLSKQWMLFYKYGRNYSLGNTVYFFFLNLFQVQLLGYSQSSVDTL